MERWQEQLSKHPIMGLLRQLKQIEAAALKIENDVTLSEYTRIIKITTKLDEVLSQLDPELAPLDTLTNIYNTLTNSGAIGVINEIVNNKNVNYLKNLNDQLNGILVYISQIRGSFTKTSTSKVDYKASSIILEKFAKNLTEKENQYSNFLNISKDKLYNIVESKDKYDLYLNETKTNIDKFISDSNNSINELKSRQNISFNETISQIKSQAENQMSALADDIDQEAKSIIDETNSFLETAKNETEIKLEEIKRLYGLVAKVSVSGGHKRIADKENKAAEIWRIISVFSILCTLVWLLYVYFKPFVEAGQDITIVFWLNLGKSLSISAMLVSFAIYASRQSSLHRVSARKAQEFFLQVQAFDPFVESLSPEDKSALKKEMTSRIFKSDDGEHDRRIVDNGDFNTVEKFIGLVESAVKATGLKA